MSQTNEDVIEHIMNVWNEHEVSKAADMLRKVLAEKDTHLAQVEEALRNAIHGGRGMMDNLMKVHVARCPTWNMTCTICRDSTVATDIFRKAEAALQSYRWKPS